MEKTKILLSALWVCLMLTYLLGDVLRIFSGDFTAGKIEGVQVTQGMYLGMAVMMLIPIIMVFLSLILGQPVSRWANIIVPVLLFVFNLVGLPTYPGLYDRFLIAVGLFINALTVFYAWTWT